MLRCIIYTLVGFFSVFHLSGQEPISETSITIIDEYDTMNGYYIFLPKEGSDKVVVFIHGYGALNPAIYGNWILNLVEEDGVIVIFPRYQENIFNPATEDFPVTMSKGILGAMEKLKEMYPEENKSVYYAGHSYGGAAVAFYANEYGKYGLPKPNGVFCAQPGTGFFKGMTLEYYDKIEKDIPVILISGDDDVVVGDRICRLVKSTIKSSNVRHVHHFPDRNKSDVLHADHHAPYDINMRLDNGIRNVSTTRAMYDAQRDLEDTALYQKLLSNLILNKPIQDLLPLGEWTYAHWPDGTPVKSALVK